MLYLVSTPIGNLSDLSPRAIAILEQCSIILCEDTRHSLPLLKHHSITTPLKSYHQHNEAKVSQEMIDKLQSGEEIALISDAGTPGISDPGALIVQACVDREIPVTNIPGPCALVQALVASGLPTDRFQFLGFLPRKPGQVSDTLLEALMYPGTTIFYESPNRILKTLETLVNLSPDRAVVVARELTKKFESFHRGTAQEVLTLFKNGEAPHKGEIVLLVEGDNEHTSKQWERLSPQEHVDYLESSFGIKHSDAIKLAAQQRGVPKRDVYNDIER